MTGAGPVAGPRPEALESILAPALHPLTTPISQLPVDGYRPGTDARPRPAAVLVGITRDDSGVVLTLRSTELARHAGQVAFPGGAREPVDDSVVDTALREAREEAGIEPDHVRPLGYLSRYDTITGYRMTAVVGVLDPGVRLEPDRSEVERVFTVPLEHVADPDRYRRDRVRFRERRYEILTLEHPEFRIWGATAALLHDLGRRLAGSSRDWR
ncbi:MAG: CoA pyrophosphatase [Candidatus Wenzhouxiangella sp. M2_3B_020]